MADRETRASAHAWAKRLGCEVAAVLAVIEVESAGQIYAVVAGRKEPLIRFEGHYFDRRLTGAARSRARALGLGHPDAGAVKNPASQSARWQLLNRALEIDAAAAFESTSWGLGQVMGAHWEWLGYDSVAHLVNTARVGVSGQMDLMGRYIEKAGLIGALQRRDWTAFARGYNGPGFARHGYHTKLAEAYRRRAGTGAGSIKPASDSMLRMGSRGARVRDLQTLLVRAGQSLTVDGDFGPATASAVRAFQLATGLTIDGVAGPQTMRALDRFRQGADDRPGAVSPLATPEARTAAGGLVGAAGLETARSQIDQAADRLAWVPGLEWLSAVLAVLAVLLVLGGLAWGIRGWIRSRRTVEVPA